MAVTKHCDFNCLCKLKQLDNFQEPNARYRTQRAHISLTTMFVIFRMTMHAYALFNILRKNFFIYFFRSFVPWCISNFHKYLLCCMVKLFNVSMAPLYRSMLTCILNCQLFGIGICFLKFQERVHLLFTQANNTLVHTLYAYHNPQKQNWLWYLLANSISWNIASLFLLLIIS